MLLNFTVEFNHFNNIQELNKRINYDSDGCCWALCVEWLRLIFEDESNEKHTMVKAHNSQFSNEKKHKNEEYYLAGWKFKSRAQARMENLRKTILRGSPSLLTRLANKQVQNEVKQNNYDVCKYIEATNKADDFLLFTNKLQRVGSNNSFKYSTIETALKNFISPRGQAHEGILLKLTYEQGGAHIISIYAPITKTRGQTYSYGYAMLFDPNIGEFVLDSCACELLITKVVTAGRKISAISIIYVEKATRW